MISLFRKNLFINSLLLLIYTALIRSAGFFVEYARAYSENSVVFNLINYLIPSHRVETLISILLVFIQASLINFLVNKNNYDRASSLFPGVFYVIFVSIIPEFLGMSPALISNTFIILALIQISRLYKKHKPTKFIFNVGWLMGLAIVFYVPNLIFVIGTIIGLFSIRAQNFKELFQMISGMLLSLFLFAALCFLIGRMDVFMEHFKVNLNIYRPDDSTFFYVFGAILTWAIYLTIQNRNLVLKKSVVVSKNINLLYWFLLLSAMLFFVGLNQYTQYKFLLITTPLSILTGLYFISLKSKWVPELIHLLLLTLLAFVHYQLPIPYMTQ